MKILFMEDDPVLGDVVTTYLQDFYDVTHVFDSADAEELIYDHKYDLFIFDLNVPGKNGIKLLEELRSFNIVVPTIIVTAYDDTKHIKSSFDAGAHDYMRKPFELEELRLRIEKSRVVFNIREKDSIMLNEELTYHPNKKIVTNGDEVWHLHPKESEILNYFTSHPNRLISSEELSQNIWDFDKLPSDATLRSYIRKLRAIIGNEKIVTIRGEGYRFE